MSFHVHECEIRVNYCTELWDRISHTKFAHGVDNSVRDRQEVFFFSSSSSPSPIKDN